MQEIKNARLLSKMYSMLKSNKHQEEKSKTK